MKLIRISIIMLIGFFALQTKAQQAPLFGLTSQLLNVSNPALMRSNTPLNVTLAGRKYWTGIQNSPEAYVASFAISPTDYKSAVGGFFWRENAPLISKQTMSLAYAYGIKNMDENFNLRLGLGLDFINISANTTSVLVDDYNDPYYTALFNNNRSSVDFRAGAVLTLSGLEIGGAVQQAVKSKNKIGESTSGNLNFSNGMIINGHVKYAVKSGDDFLITPLIFWQSQKNTPLRIDMNLLLEKTGKVWAGAYIRPKATYGVMGGLWVLPDVKVGYMYEKTFFNAISKAGNSHEIMISYSPSFKSSSKKETPKPEVVIPEVQHVVDTLVIVKEVRITEPAAPEVKKEETPAPERPAPKASGTKYYVVTGLFSVKSNATTLSNKLKALGYKPMLVKNGDKDQFYVAVGKFDSSNDAHEFIKKNGRPDYTFWVKEMAE